MTDENLPADTAPTTVQEALRPSGGNGKRVVVGMLVAALLSAAAVVVFRSAAGPDPVAARVPASVIAYVQATVQPSISQKQLLADLADGLPGGRDGVEDAVEITLERLLDGAPDGLSAEEAREWIGDELAVVLWSEGEAGAPQPFLVAHVSDEAAAQRAVDAVNASGNGAASLDRDFVTLAPDAGALASFRDAAGDRSLARDARFKAARQRVGGDGILLSRFDLRAVAALRDDSYPVGIQQSSPAMPAEEPEKGGSPVTGNRNEGESLVQTPRGEPSERIPDGSVVAGVRVVEGGVELTLVEETGFIEGPLPRPDDLALLHELAADAHAALGIHDVAALIRQALDLAPDETVDDLENGLGFDLEEDILSWLGGELALALVAGDDDEVSGTLAIEASDEDAMRSFIGTLRGFIGFVDGVDVEGDSDAFTVRTEEMTFQVTVDGPRLTVNARSGRVGVARGEAGSLRGLPEDDASIAGAVNLRYFEDWFFPQELAEGGAFARYGDSVEALAFAATTDASGPRVTVTLLFERGEGR